MTELIDKFTSFITNMGPDQMASFAVMALAISFAASVAKKALSMACSVLGLLAGLYFIAPDLYAKAYEILMNLANIVVSKLA